MSLQSDMKKIHIKQFKERKIQQATFLKSFKKEISDLLSLGYKPSEITDYFAAQMDVTIEMNSFYAWLHYNKESIYNTHNTAKTSLVSNTDNTSTPFMEKQTSTNTIDILSSTDFD